jgi:hypothetical protein
MTAKRTVTAYVKWYRRAIAENAEAVAKALMTYRMPAADENAPSRRGLTILYRRCHDARSLFGRGLLQARRKHGPRGYRE